MPTHLLKPTPRPAVRFLSRAWLATPLLVAIHSASAAPNATGIDARSAAPASAIAAVQSAPAAPKATAPSKNSKKIQKPKPTPEPELPWPAELEIPPSPSLSPENEAKTFRLAPGFRAELVAADPLIGEPVTILFDADGRLWVVEMRGYMQDIDGTNEAQLNGRISVLEDTDGDGRCEKQTIFLDNILMPRAIAFRKGGVLVADNEHLFWCPDANGDLKADSQDLLVRNYSIGGNPEHKSNGLLRAMDNWIYNAKSSARFRYDGTGALRSEQTLFRGQWGICQDDAGRLFYNYNSDQLRGDLLPAESLMRNPQFRSAPGANDQVAKDQSVFPIRVTPGVNRAYRKGMLVNGKLKDFTAASAPAIYRGDLFPAEFRGNSFVPEPSANLIKRNIHQESDGEITATHAYEDTEFMASTDERFRPVTLANGPDGALYVVDMYRGVIQHITYVSPWLRRQFQARDLHAPVHQGRIWRIVPEEKTAAKKFVPMSKMTPAQWVAALESPNGWTRDTAQQLLVDQQSKDVVPSLEALLQKSTSAQARLHAFWTLEGLDALSPAVLAASLKDKDLHVRSAALRLVNKVLSPEDAAKVVARATADREGRVRLHAVLAAGDLGANGLPIIKKALVKEGEKRLMLSAALSGLRGQEIAVLTELMQDPAFAESREGRSGVVGRLAKCVLIGGDLDAVSKVLALAAEEARPMWQRLALLDGFAPDKSIRKLEFPRQPAALVALGKATEADIKGRVTKALLAVTWPGKPGEAPKKVLPPLTDKEKEFLAAGKITYTNLCGTCHQPTGQGQEGLAPPLAGSEWVTGSENRLIRIVLHGLGGPVQVNGRVYTMDMPGLGLAFNDEQLAQVLSYIRREWGHTAPFVKPETVAEAREEESERTGTWTAEELALYK